MNWSTEQTAIFNWGETGHGNAVIEAYAGTGKTTTAKELFSHCPESTILYAVFNKRNQLEAQTKITDSRVDVRTLHSLGYRYIQNVWRGVKPDGSVEFDRIKKAAGEELTTEHIGSMVQLVSRLKNTCIEPSVEDIANAADILDLELPVNFVEIAQGALDLAKSRDMQSRISFDDMVWLPVAMNWVRPDYELVLCDEAQDQSLPQLMMVRQASSGRVVVVGDSRQAIYSFRGAVQNSMQWMTKELNAQVFTLSTTYRCPRSVVTLANKIVPGYNAHETAPDGSVSVVQTVYTAKPGDFILSRLNAPLMGVCLGLIKRNIPARIEGRDIGHQLATIAKKLNARSVPEFISKLDSWYARQVKRFQGTKNAEQKLENSQDIRETLEAVAEDAKSVSDIVNRLQTMFSDKDDVPMVVCSSVHKAKGLESERVFILAETLRYGKTVEESNICYVAITRSKNSLFFVGKFPDNMN